MIRYSWEKALLLAKDENGSQVKLFASRRGKCTPCQEGGEKGSAPPRAEKKDPAYILVRKAKTYVFIQS